MVPHINLMLPSKRTY